MGTLLHDIRYGVRMLRKNPGFTIVAVITLALGIGANAAIFTVVRSVLLQPLPYPAQDRLAAVSWRAVTSPPGFEIMGYAADFLREHSGSFESTAVFDDSPIAANFSTSTEPLHVNTLRVSQDFFRTVGIGPVRGRVFSAEEDRQGGPPAVVLSDGLWRRAFNRDPAMLGRSVRLNEESYTVVGIMPARFVAYPEADLWLPLRLGPHDPGYQGTNFGFLGRMKPGIVLGQAQQEMELLTDQLLQANPEAGGWSQALHVRYHLKAASFRDGIVGEVRQSLLVLVVAVGFVLLIACTNLAALLLARASARSREIVLRAALGASRWQVVRLLMVESLLLATLGGALGLLLAVLAVPALLAASPAEIPRTAEIHIGWAVVGFTLLASCLTALLFGLIPALHMYRGRDKDTFALGQGSHQIAGVHRGQNRLGGMLIAGQTALAVVLLTGAVLLLGSFLKLRRVAPGFETKKLYALQVALSGKRYATTAETERFVQTALVRMRTIPGVSEAASVNGLPLDRGLNNWAMPEGRKSDGAISEFRSVSPGYLHAVGSSLLAGRDFADADNSSAAPVAIINQAMARQWWPGRSAIGEYVVSGGGKPMQIVGVVADVHEHSLADPPNPCVFAPMSQLPDVMTATVNGWFPTSFVLRVAAPVNLATALQDAVHAADPEVPVAKLEPMQEFVDSSVAQPRFYGWLTTSFAGFALLLTIVGLFGVLSYQVSQRTRELGVRMALGAQPANVLGMVLKQGMLLSLVGLMLGLAGALGTERLLANMLYGVSVSHGIVMAVVSASVLGAALLASYLPARGAARVDPMVALRYE